MKFAFPLNPQIRKIDLIYFLICLLLGWSYLAWAYTGYSQGEPDSLWFLPAAVSYHKGEGLYNRLHEPTHIFDPIHKKRFLFYPPGLQLVLSTILFESTGRGAFFALALINFLSLILSALLFYRVLRGRRLFLGILGMLALSTYLGSFRTGRPDFLATFIVLLMTFVQIDFRDRLQEILSAVLLGILAFVHPVAAFFVSALLGMRYSCDNAFLTTFLKMTRICLGGILLFLLLMALAPHGWKDSFHGILLHSENTMICGTKATFLKYWIIHSYASCYGILFMVVVWLACGWTWRHKDEIASKRGLMIFGGFLIAFCYHFVAIAWDRCYNLWIFAPLMIAFMFEALEREWVKKRFMAIFISVVFLLCSIGYFHASALFGFYLKYGYKYEDARRDFQKFMREHPTEHIGVSKSLWVLSEEYERMCSFGLNPAHLRCRPDWIILQQRFHLDYTPEPPPIEGYQLVSHNFSPLKAKLFGLQLSPTMPGYFYAVYKLK